MTGSLKLTAALAAVLLALVATASASGAAVENRPYLEASPSGSFDDACGVAIGPGGLIYVSDYYSHAVDFFSGTGLYAGQIGGVDPLDGPCGLAVGSGGQLFVNDYHRDVRRFGPAEIPSGPGAVIDSGHPTGVAVDPASGHVFVDDRTYIAEYELSGAPVEVGGEPVRIGVGSLGDGYGVAVSGFAATAGLIYVADATDDVVEVYDPTVSDATPVQTIDGAGTPQRGFSSLADSSLAVDPSDGHLLVLDNPQPGFEHPAAVVDEFNTQGDYRGQLPHAIVDGEPSGIALNAAGNTYVTSGNGPGASVQAFGPGVAGQVLTVAKTGAGAGTVRSTPAPGIACGTACSAEYDTGPPVTLAAVPAAGSSFAGWSGCEQVTESECTETMSADRSVSAEFVPDPAAPSSSPGGGSDALRAAAADSRDAGSAGPADPVAGASEIEQKGNLRVVVKGEMAPKSLPRQGAAPVSVSVGGAISTTDGSDPPQLRQIRVAINREGRLDYKGLPVCAMREIQPSTDEAALAACGEAKVGEGSFSADVKFPQQSPFPSKGKLIAFNGFEKGHPVILAHVYGTEPLPTSLTIPLRITKSKGTFGTVLTGSLPQVASSVGFVTGIDLTLKRTYRYRGKSHSYLSAGCPAPKGFPGATFPLAKASFGFAGGRTLSQTLERSCKAR